MYFKQSQSSKKQKIVKHCYCSINVSNILLRLTYIHDILLGKQWDEFSESVKVGVGYRLINIFIMKPIFKV